MDYKEQYGKHQKIRIIINEAIRELKKYGYTDDEIKKAKKEIYKVIFEIDEWDLNTNNIIDIMERYL